MWSALGEVIARGWHVPGIATRLLRTEPAAREGCAILSAETRADFPGARGRLYRALVIGTRGHVLAVRTLLHATRRLAERH